MNGKGNESVECNNCSNLGLCYKRNYAPWEYLEGKPNSRIWIIGLNPKNPIDWQDGNREQNDLANYFDSDIHSYFKDFKTVSPKLFSLFGQKYGVAHTDLVKCSSQSWPPVIDNKKVNEKELINNCLPHLKRQIEDYQPQMIICNGAAVCNAIKQLIKPPQDYDTSYVTMFNNKPLVVVLSGFIGRIDNYAKRRLGKEIENLMKLYL